MKINYEPQFQCRFADLIKSIEEDDMRDVMTFPATFEEFAEQYKIVDKREVYTNGTELIPIFRVKQWLNNAGVAPKSGWISVKDSLPNESGRYMYAIHIWDDSYIYGVVNYSAKHKLFNTRDELSYKEAKLTAIEATYWMHLPEPPKMKGGE